MAVLSASLLRLLAVACTIDFSNALAQKQRNPGTDELSRREAFQHAASSTAITTTSSGLLFPGSATAADDALTTMVPKVRLGNSKLEISRTIQGHWQLAGGHGTFNERDVLTNMKAHFDAGITSLDTADIYGSSE